MMAALDTQIQNANTTLYQRLKPNCILWLRYWLMLGIAMQAGLALWPIGNYATSVYLGFYLPLLILILLDAKGLVSLLKTSDSLLLAGLLFFLSWVVLSSLWATTAEGTQANLTHTFRLCLLIALYVLGVAYISAQQPSLIIWALCIALLLTALLSLDTLNNTLQLILENKLKFRVGFRLTTFSITDLKDKINPVIAGIYFGALVVIAVVLMLAGKNESTLLPKINTAFFFLAQLIFATLFLVMAILTGTRTAIVALSAAACIALLVTQRYWLLGTLVALGVWFFAFALLEETSALHKLINRGGLGSGRPQIWLASITASLDHWLVGAGMWTESPLEAFRGKASSTHNHAHNAYLQLLHWTGLIGVLAYISVYARALLISKQQCQHTLGLVAFFLLAYFAVVQVFDVYSVISKPNRYWLCVWLPLGIALGLVSSAKASATDNQVV